MHFKIDLGSLGVIRIGTGYGGVANSEQDKVMIKGWFESCRGEAESFILGEDFNWDVQEAAAAMAFRDQGQAAIDFGNIL